MRARLTLHGRHGNTQVTSLQDVLTPALREDARVEANRWIKTLRSVPYGADSMRSRFRYRGESLWWFTEIYLHKLRRMDTAIATVLALEHARALYDPVALTLETEDGVARTIAAAFGVAHGVRVEGVHGTESSAPAVSSFVREWSARLSRLRGRTPLTTARRPRVLAFVHTAFWRGAADDAASPTGEQYIGPVLDVLAQRLSRDELVCVGVGPRRNFRARRWWDPLVSAPDRPMVLPIERLAPHTALRDSRALFGQRQELADALTSGDAIRDAARFRGVDLWPILEADLRATALLQWPWAARAMDEAAAAMDAIEPERIVTYAEAGGWGRALIIEARRRAIPSAGLQHGFIYRHWLNYLHEPDEMAADENTPEFPRPDRTLLFDRLALEHLRTAGSFPPAALDVTGNPRLDELAARVGDVTPAGREAARTRVGVTGNRCLALLTAKHSEIRSELPALADALDALPDVQLVVKPHPAETPDVYVEVAGRDNVTVVAANADLAELLAAADAIVTMNSTVAVDGLVLGVPAIVLGLPNNLSPLVEAGAMSGVAAGAPIAGPLQAVLYDRNLRERLERAGRGLIAAGGLGADQQAATRAADAILGLRRTTP
jgi:hypothetical protein